MQMKFDVILHGDITESVTNFDQRVAKLCELIHVDINFIGPFLSARETIVMKDMDFNAARQVMSKINAIGFKAEVRPTKKKAVEKHAEVLTDSHIPVKLHNISMSQNRARFNAPTDLPEDDTSRFAEASAGTLAEVKTLDELAIARDEDTYSNYNWSKDTDSDEIVLYEDNLVIKKGR